MQFYKPFWLGLVLSFGFILTASATDEMPQHQHQHQHQSETGTPLTAPGNDAFAAIQEAVNQLLADPKTDWRHVDLEALRQHLIDMQNFTFNVDVIKQSPIANGVQFTVKATSARAAKSLQRLFSAHPAILKQESGWDMQVSKNKNGSYTVQVTGANAQDGDKIRGLGYIGLVAYGSHHQAHHWQMAKGINPHAHQHQH